MKRVLFSELSKDRVDGGLDWLDKYPGVDVRLVNQGLKPDAVDEATRKGFTTCETGDFLGHADLNFFNVILNYEIDQFAPTKPEDMYVYVGDPEKGYDLDAAWSGQCLVAGMGADTNVDNLVFPVTSISRRVDLSNLLEERVLGRYDALLDSRVMGGPHADWRKFLSLYKSLAATGMIEHTTQASRNLCLNLFVAWFPERFKLCSLRGRRRT